MSLTSYRAAPSRDNVCRVVVEGSLERYFWLLIRFGSDLLSHALRRSTISAAALNCRVRDGIGCFARAMTTKSKKKPTSDFSPYALGPTFVPYQCILMVVCVCIFGQ